MVKENIEKLYKHFCKLAEEGGKTENKVRNMLIKEDAIINKERLEKKFSFLKEEKVEEKPKKGKKGGD
jgi:hypothetical protein